MTFQKATSQVSAIAVLTLLASEAAYAGGDRTVINVSYDYAQVRLRPTYNDRIRGVFQFQLVLSGDKHISVNISNKAGKYSADWGGESSAGGGASHWHFTGPHELTRVKDWPQSRTTTVIRVSDAGTCSVRVVATLKPGFSEYKLPMLSQHQFGYYRSISYGNFSCKIRNE